MATADTAMPATAARVRPSTPSSHDEPTRENRTTKRGRSSVEDEGKDVKDECEDQEEKDERQLARERTQCVLEQYHSKGRRCSSSGKKQKYTMNLNTSDGAALFVVCANFKVRWSKGSTDRTKCGIKKLLIAFQKKSDFVTLRDFAKENHQGISNEDYDAVDEDNEDGYLRGIYATHWEYEWLLLPEVWKRIQQAGRALQPHGDERFWTWELLEEIDKEDFSDDDVEDGDVWTVPCAAPQAKFHVLVQSEDVLRWTNVDAAE